MNSVVSMILRTLVRGEVYRLMRRSKAGRSLAIAVIAAVALVVMHGHR